MKTSTMEKALDQIVSEVARNRDYYKLNHPVLFRAVEIIEIVMKIGPNRGAAMSKALHDIIPEVIINRYHYEQEHPEIFRSIQTLVTERSEIFRHRRVVKEINRKTRREEKPARGRRLRRKLNS